MVELFASFVLILIRNSVFISFTFIPGLVSLTVPNSVPETLCKVSTYNIKCKSSSFIN